MMDPHAPVPSPDYGREFERVEAAFEDSIADRYHRDYHRPPILRAHTADFARYVAEHYRPRDRVLDLGCGPASLWDEWATHLPRASLIGVDISPKMVEQAKQRAPHGDFRVGSALRIPVESNTIDLVVASSMLHHLPDSALPEALQEISRVLAEHGKLVGREPVAVGRLADDPGWLSGAIMAFRHVACRLTHTREYAEPENTPHHHAYDPEVFFQILSRVFATKGVRLRHPFSYYVGRVDHPVVERLALWIDEWMNHRRGQEFYYVAEKNYHDAADVAEYVKRELAEGREYDRERFMALLQEAAALLERELARDNDG